MSIHCPLDHLGEISAKLRYKVISFPKYKNGNICTIRAILVGLEVSNSELSDFLSFKSCREEIVVAFVGFNAIETSP